MAKERFLIIASPMMDDCFSAFSETKNRAAKVREWKQAGRSGLPILEEP